MTLKLLDTNSSGQAIYSSAGIKQFRMKIPSNEACNSAINGGFQIIAILHWRLGQVRVAYPHVLKCQKD